MHCLFFLPFTRLLMKKGRRGTLCRFIKYMADNFNLQALSRPFLCMIIFWSLTISLSHTQTHRHTDTQTHRHTNTQTQTHTDTHTLSHTNTHTLSHNVCRTHTLYLIHTLSISLSLFQSQSLLNTHNNWV